jgi:undecaprenyl-diphosphatase
MIPAVVIGLFFEAQITSLFKTNLVLVGAMLCLTAVLLFFTDKASNKKQPISYKIALLIGIAQAVAILPGISRSGATIAVALLIGVNRTQAARFSFLMVIPLILGSMVKSILDQGTAANISIDILPLGVGFLAALVSGVLACTWMIALVKRSKLSYFAIYCLLVGITASIVAWA